MLKKFFLIAFLVKLYLSLKPTDLCNNIQEECIGSYDLNQKYKVKCKSVKCQGKFSFKCSGINKCAVNKKDCEAYSFLSYSLNLPKLKAFINEGQLRTNTENKKEKLKLFYESIEKCPSIPYEWKPSDVCINGIHCLTQKTIPMRSGMNLRIK